MKKERLSGIDFIRAFCALGILAYHFCCHTASGFKPVYAFADGATFGTVFVNVFFMVSGAILYYNYGDLKPSGWVAFYRSRWKRLFPVYLLAWAFFYLENVSVSGAVFWGGSPWKVLLSLIGMDGYLNYLTAPNYYIIGEWFFGAIILLYLFFPLIAAAFRKNTVLTLAADTVLFIVVLLTDIVQISDSRNPVTCLLPFLCGMAAVKYRRIFLDNIRTGILSAVVFAALLLFGRYIDYRIVDTVSGISLFFVLYHLGKQVEKNRFLKTCAHEIGGKLSFPLFLVHHQVIVKVLAFRNPVGIKGSVCMLAVSCLLSLIFAWALYSVNQALLSSRLFTSAREKAPGK